MQSSSDPGNGNSGSDWICSNCSHRNYFRRQNCYKCQALNSNNITISFSSQTSKIVESNQSSKYTGRRNESYFIDWVCTNCSYKNFSTRQVCRECQKDKDPCKKVGKKRPSSEVFDLNSNSKKRSENYDKVAEKRHNCDDLVSSSIKRTKNQEPSIINKSSSKILEKCEILLKLIGRPNISHSQIEDKIASASSFWLKCWEIVNQLSTQHLEVMLGALNKVSISVIQDAYPPIEQIKTAVKNYLLGSKGSNEILSKVEMVHNMVKKLLAIQWKEEKEIVKKELKTILSSTISVLSADLPDHFEIIKSILETITSLDKPWAIKETLKSVQSSTNLVEVAAESSSWQNVNISWLANVKYFQPALLPVMKVPSDKSSGVYNSAEEYFEIVMQLWIGLTFIDGNSNLNPKCCHKFQEKKCGQVLLPSGEEKYEVHCLNSCSFPVVLQCTNSRHTKGLCSKCAQNAKAELMGPAGPCASTNIYDCQVTKVDYEGRIYMNAVESRKPPNQIHWRSTRRLSSANLVGLVKLSAQGASLNYNDIIIWGEIVSHGDPRDEFKRREEKCLCVSIVTINNSKFLENIKKDDYIAVIDCMTFAPEHIPVLKALDIQKVSTLPFQKGALLNIGIDKDITNFEICSQKLNSFIDEKIPLSSFKTKLEMIIDLIIDQSQVHPIVCIRGDEKKASKLREQLTHLISSTTLDNKQLQSFAEALIEPVHLTQGPPGTGKSYLGVVVVQALIIIQKLCYSDLTFGVPPILVLSYKNHAIDEFLTDLIKAEHNVELIRIGNSDEPNLYRYSEKSIRSSDYKVKQTTDTLQLLLKQKEDYRKMQNELSPILIYEALVQSNPQDKNEIEAKKIASYQAAYFLGHLIYNSKKLNYFLNEINEDGFYDLLTIWDDMFNKGLHKNDIVLKNSDIQTLWKGINHSNEIENSFEIILKWIEGFEPLPQCSFNNHRIITKKNALKVCKDGIKFTQNIPTNKVEKSKDAITNMNEQTSQTLEKISNQTSDEKDCFTDNNGCNKNTNAIKTFNQNAIDVEDLTDEPANYQHMREVYNFEEVEDGEIEEDLVQTNLNEFVNLDELKSMQLPEDWRWDMSLEDRWCQCKLLEKNFNLLLSQLNDIRNAEIETLRKKLYEEKVKANTRVYERKSVIGGTIVGCITRLEAIRNTKPFAILIEEASEVLEPLVFSCLSETTCKLEMIGDHLQLKPSVMSNYMFEHRNKINFSMFERLICAPKSQLVPFSVLSTQRRMRKSICDLTRNFYKHITNIEDHDICNSRKIGDNFSGTSIKYKTFDKLKICSGNGREVPGVLPNIFFWTHEGTQTKAKVGLSRINSTEAEMVIGLTEYLVNCGVPKSSIAILTPYKGQLMLMRLGLINLNLLNNKDKENSIVLSTVDRFQGDEADIVIISLVIDAMSYTGFVKKLNRMIVLLSRARLGMYIIGNINYFEEKPDGSTCHWTDILTKLRQSCEPDMNPSAVLEKVENLHYYGPRLGNELPICCPVHREKMVYYAKSVQQLKLNFCKEKCSELLSCKHSCDLLCHFKNKDDHNKNCSVVINPPPCETHAKNLSCHELYKNVRTSLPICNALKLYKCLEKVSVQLPCLHDCMIYCWEENEIAQGKRIYPECKQLAHNPYIYPMCCHELPVLCFVYHQYKKNPTEVKSCKSNVTYNPPCSHSVTVQCFLKQQYENGKAVFTCNHVLDKILPRCGHKVNIHCDVFQTLNNWTGQSSELGVVYEGRNYGPVDYICNESVDFFHICKHVTKMACHLAFENASRLNKCYTDVDIINPDCGHPTVVKCYDNQMLKNLPLKDPISEIKEEEISLQFNNHLQNHKCTFNILFHRRCGHSEKIQCYKVRGKHNQVCVVSVDIINPLCGHKLSLPCHLSDLSDWKPWKNGTCSKFVNNVLFDDCPPPIFPSNELFNIVKRCKSKINVQRKSCGHQYSIDCGVAFNELSNKTLRICSEVIKDVHLNCGHIKTMSCSSYQIYKNNPESYSCTEQVIMSCWNIKNCKEKVLTECCKRSDRCNCKKKIDWTCLNGHTIKKTPICQKGIFLECHDCIFESSKKNILNAAENLDLLKFFPNELKSFEFEELISSDCLNGFLHSQSKLIEYVSSWLIKQSSLKRPRIEFMYVLCFILLTDQTIYKKPYSKDMFRKASTFNGIEVLEWTLNNVKQLITEAEKKRIKFVEILFGVALVCNTKVESEVKTYDARKRIYKIANDITNSGYDSLQHCSSNWEYLILWYPYVFAPTHKLKLQTSQLKRLYDQLKISQKSNMLSRKSFKEKFPQQIIPDDASSLVIDIHVKYSSEEVSNFETVNAYDGINIQDKWNGKSMGRTVKSLQNELLKKLQFCINPSSSSDNPVPLFSGINYLKNLLTQNDYPEINLLMSLEYCKLECFKDAKVELDKYITHVKKSKTTLNPLFLLAKARIAYNEQNLVDSKELLNKFSKLHPNALKSWCEDNEIRLVNVEHSSPLQLTLTENNLTDLISKWNKLKDRERVASKAMDALVKMTGLQKVKEFAVDLFKFSLKFSQFSQEAKSANVKTLNFCFLGNAGSGKTTVARLLAEILKDSGLRLSNTFVESSAQKLKDDGPDKFRSLAASAKNGVLFIDEAYDLDPKGDSQGKQIVSELLVISENDREHLSIILAGYEDDMNEKLFSYNEGIKSRFEIVHFEDFDESELKTIWNGEIEKRKFVCDDSVSTVVSKRLAKMSGKKGFGNARAVRKEVEKAIQVAMARENFNPSKLIINIEDVVGESPLENPKLKAILKEFDEKIGWKAVKKSVNQLIEICKNNFTLQLMGKKTLPIMLNRLFLGNPGTGKTTCAKLYGRLLKELNFLSIGDVVMSTASDFVGSHVGESPKKTNAMIEKARGKVLVIDEAYNLNDKLYGKEVLDVLVEKVQNTESDDIAVLLLGYEPQMREMLREQNPGLARRFAMDYAFIFEDYDESELFDILKGVCKKENIQMSMEVSKAILKLLEKQRAQANFGNAGAIDNVIRAALAKASYRPLTSGGMIDLISSDIGDVYTEKVKGSDPFAPLNKLYRVENIRQQLIEIKNTFQVAQTESSKDRPELGHFVFQGAPGTGKTTVARVMAEILFDLELLPRNHVEETSGLGLTGEFVGQTKKRVKDKLDAARGGILFIDEAYELGKNHYGEEAISTLIAAMTDPNYKLVIVIAGYPKDMEQMLSVNVGLKSRFKRVMNFEDWNNNDCIKFLGKKAEADNYDFDIDVKNNFHEGLVELRSYPGWGNARDMIALWQKMLEHRANRVVKTPEVNKKIIYLDAINALKAMVNDRKPKVANAGNINSALKEANELQSVYQYDYGREKKLFEVLDKSTDNVVISKRFEETIDPLSHIEEINSDLEDIRDFGVPDEVWKELHLAKLAAKEEKKNEEKRQTNEKKYREEQEKLLNELLRELQEEREEEKRQQMLQELEKKREEERKRREAEDIRLKEERQITKDVENAIRKVCLCPAGYSWYKQGGGWRCGGGSHFVTDEQLQRQFTTSA
ncbi:uncharacterized protein LOC136084823 isoform X2 [Hydra vulgaris]|uniref:Uncharacterized protein LOC136084823 isoform X2 n=1 Tax=Hydra vulgaris TaxID=6087 RepID=A0ABM4CJK4_HYDVU